MKIHELTPAPDSNKAVKRVGRGHGSGNGKTAERTFRRRCKNRLRRRTDAFGKTYS